jgi:hypothetical protein
MICRRIAYLCRRIASELGSTLLQVQVACNQLSFDAFFGQQGGMSQLHCTFRPILVQEDGAQGRCFYRPQVPATASYPPFYRTIYTHAVLRRTRLQARWSS